MSKINIKYPLHDLHSRILEMPENFRGFVASECKWSLPTYHRKLKHPEQCSQAELEAIVKIAKALAVDLMVLVGRCREDNL